MLFKEFLDKLSEDTKTGKVKFRKELPLKRIRTSDPFCYCPIEYIQNKPVVCLGALGLDSLTLNSIISAADNQNGPCQYRNQLLVACGLEEECLK